MVEIRSVSDADIAECLEIYNYYVENTCFSLEENTVPYEKYVQTVHAITAGYPFIVACENGTVIGFSYLNVFNERSAYRRTADLTIYVRKEKCGEGVGEKLLYETEKLAKEKGITNIVSLITSENADSLKFHEKNGFIHEGTLHDVAVKFGNKYGLCFYRKPI